MKPGRGDRSREPRSPEPQSPTPRLVLAATLLLPVAVGLALYIGDRL